MQPAWSILLFTTVAGLAQGMVVALAVASLAMGRLPREWMSGSLALAAVLLVGALIASFFHLGHPKRAWRAALMWRTSWMSREVIVLPAFIALVAAWAAAAASSVQDAVVFIWMPVLAIAGALLLWYCTAMIYACLRFIQEWAHPLTPINYTLIGLASGWVLAAAMAGLAHEDALRGRLLPGALLLTLLAWGGRLLALRRNSRLKPKSTVQSATGIRDPRLVQRSMGMTAGSFNTREFFVRATLATIQRTRWLLQVLAFALPLLLMAVAVWSGSVLPLVAAVPVQFVGLLADRWFFFAQARHPQNLYYQFVS